LDQFATAARVRGLAIRTEQTYLHWITRYIGFLGNADPAQKGAEQAAAFLEHLAVERKDRVVPLPERSVDEVRGHLARVHHDDLHTCAEPGRDRF
jgi:hypothetical protein